jgi:hypothetical protein
MRKLILILIVGYQLSGKAQTNIHYYYENDNVMATRVLKAVVNDKVYSLSYTDDDYCNRITKEADFNGDGYTDVLVEVVNGCGGNCCANSFVIFSFDGEKFRNTEAVGYDWNGVEISESSVGYNFIIQTINGSGVGNNEMCTDKIETFKLDNYQFELVQVIEEKKLKSITELTSANFENKENETLFLSFDIDGDGKQDKITSRYWFRWGVMKDWKVEFGNGKSYEGSSQPKRIGIYTTKTNGVYDIIVDCEDVLKWNGTTYE